MTIRITNDYWSKTLNRTASMADFMPKISQHVTNEIISYEKGYYAFTIRMDGLPFDGADDRRLFAHFANLRAVLNGIGKTLGNRGAVWTTLKRERINFDREYGFQNLFCRRFADSYLRRFREEDYYENRFYLTLVIKSGSMASGIKECEEQMQILMRALDPYSPEILSAWENAEETAFSDAYRFYSGLVSGREGNIPLSPQSAYKTIPAASLHFGTDLCEIRPEAGGRKYAMLYDLRDFGISKPKILTSILTLPCEFTLTQSMIFISPYDMQNKIKRQLKNLTSVEDKAEAQQEELEYGMGRLVAGEIMFGDYSAALAVFGRTPAETADNGAKAYSAFLNSGGFRFMKAGYSAPSTWFSQIPGSKDRPRSFPKTTENLACTFGIHNYSHGKKSGNPLGDGSAVMPLQTTSKTVYDFNFHFTNLKDDNIGEKIAGHTLILGATGSGKTTLQCALMAFAERFDPYLFALDLDRGMEIFIRAIGGSYFALEAGKPTGLNPFQLPDTPENREFLYALAGICGQDAQGRLTAAEEKQIQNAVDATMDLDWSMRRFSHMLQHIPMLAEPDCLYVRLAKWCESENGRFAWCLDNPKNLFDPADFWRVGFDLTDILKDGYPPTAPVLAYMFHLRNIMMDKVAEKDGLLASIIEEFWWPLRFSATEELMLKILKTDRKRGGWLILVSQSPEDAIASRIFPAIVQQTPTKHFLPNPDAEYEGSYQRCGITRKEYEELIKLPLESRTFLVKQSKQSAFAKLDLHGMHEAIAVLSGNTANVELLHHTMAEYGSDVRDWYEPFVLAATKGRAVFRQSEN